MPIFYFTIKWIRRFEYKSEFTKPLLLRNDEDVPLHSRNVLVVLVGCNCHYMCLVYALVCIWKKKTLAEEVRQKSDISDHRIIAPYPYFVCNADVESLCNLSGVILHQKLI